MNIPSNERGQDSKSTASPQKTGVSMSRATVVEVGKTKHEECHVKGEEEQEEGDG